MVASVSHVISCIGHGASVEGCPNSSFCIDKLLCLTFAVFTLGTMFFTFKVVKAIFLINRIKIIISRAPPLSLQLIPLTHTQTLLPNPRPCTANKLLSLRF